jgi:hypothetical protein
MALPKFILGYNKQSKKWELTDGKKAVVKRLTRAAVPLGRSMLAGPVRLGFATRAHRG